jgi:4-amino-4-deoxy-L-arabinose transferase-like glycosyltransferase
VAVYPNLWVNDGLIMSEALFALLVSLVLLHVLRLAAGPTGRQAATVGLLCGVAVLARAELALLVPLVVAPTLLLHRRGQWRSNAALLGITVLAAVAVVAPWALYNLSRFKGPALISTGDGAALLGSNCDQTYHGEFLGSWDFDCSTAGEVVGDVSQDAAHRRAAAIQYARNNLDRVPAVVGARVGRVWGAYRPVQTLEAIEKEGRPLPVSIAGLVGFYMLVPLAIAGFVLLGRRGVPRWPLASQFLLVTLIAATVRGEVRFRIPAEVALVVLASVALAALLPVGAGQSGSTRFGSSWARKVRHRSASSPSPSAVAAR